MQRPNGLKENECDAGKLYCDDEVAVEEQEEEKRGCSGGFLWGGRRRAIGAKGLQPMAQGRSRECNFIFIESCLFCDVVPPQCPLSTDLFLFDGDAVTSIPHRVITIWPPHHLIGPHGIHAANHR